MNPVAKSKLSSKTVNYLLLGVMALMIIISVVGADQVVGLLHRQSINLVSLKAKNQALNTEQTDLTIAKKEVVKYSPLEKIAESIVPQDKDQAQTVREIVNLATASGIKLSSVVFPVSNLGQVVAATPATQQLSLSQLTPVKGISGVYVLPITIQDSGNGANEVTYASFFNFLTNLENNRRTSQVTGLSIKPSTHRAGYVTFSLSLNEYIKPQ